MSKRGENIRKRSDGRWESRLLNKETGKYKYFYGKTYSEVKQKRYDFDISMQSKTRKAHENDAKEVNLSCGFDLWLSEIKVSVKRSTYLNYDNIIRLHLLPILGDVAISKITVRQINRILSEWLKTKASGLSEKYIHDILTVLKASLSYISVKYDCTINTQEIISVPVKNKCITILGDCEQQQLVRYLLENPDYSKIGIILCLYTGMRIGEICALKWSDIHIGDGYIDINKTIYRLKNIEGTSDCGKIPMTVIAISKPKTDTSIRKIPISDFVGKILSGTGKHDPDNYFLTNSSKYIEPRTYQNHFKRYLQLAGIQKVNFHVLRHTFATNCINAGCDIKSISEILGHASVKITLDRYVHPSMDSKKNQLDKLTVYSF